MEGILKCKYLKLNDAIILNRSCLGQPVIILEELSLPYELELLSWQELAGEEFAKINPGGKVPAMHDPNTDVQIYESGAIVLYLIEQYDTEKKLTYTDTKQKALLYQWLMFQMSQQGPYYGQVSWFKVLHTEPLPSAIDRYTRQAERIMRLLDEALAPTTPTTSSTSPDSPPTYLVGPKCTYADLAFYPWHEVIPLSMQYPPGETPISKYPNLFRWHKAMGQREAVRKAMGVRREMMEREKLEGGLPGDVDIEEVRRELAGRVR
ncbi:hypothetical protein FQN50_000451 [Emmonsiellopsis sp. PD_5]|nr:hypothetical protein FQN50_000451 [Emmonsiellopsis sp. PD_5]